MLDADHGADVVDVLEPDLFGRLVELRRHRDVALDARQALEQLERLLAADRERDEDPRIHHGRLQRQDREM